MSTPTLDDARNRMNNLRAQLKTELQKVDDNTSYSEPGRRLERGKVVLRHRKQAQQMKEQFVTQVAARRLDLEGRIFGLPDGGDALSYRDATDRASKIVGKTEALQQLERAVRSRDDMLARAIAARAYEFGMSTVLDVYGQCRSEEWARNDLDELRQLPEEDGLAVKLTFEIPAAGAGVELSEVRAAEDAVAEAS